MRRAPKEPTESPKPLTKEERKLLDQGLASIEKGDVLSNEEVRREINLWLAERQ